MSEIKAILFDVGGVLVDFRGLDEVANFMRNPPANGNIRGRWISSPAIIQFETGKLTREEFASRFVEEWDLTIAPAQFLDLFKSWLTGPMPGVTAMLDELRHRFTLACLSNTNDIHWEMMLGKCGLAEQLHRHYSSHLMGKLKPDPAIFAEVCGDFGFSPDEILFLDDGAENIEGARRFGMNAFQVLGPEGVRRQLAELGYL